MLGIKQKAGFGGEVDVSVHNSCLKLSRRLSMGERQNLPFQGQMFV